MEQRRSPGHDQWFYESQSRPQTQSVAPLVPEAAWIEDRFLLGLQQDAPALQPLLQQFQPALLAARDLSHILFPDKVTTSLTHTLTLYDRLSIALTVAQVAGVQRLCNHYSARLNPLPGPDSSRESNNRLTQITQYARQLATQPELITQASLQALDAVGLTEPDIVTLNQVIGYVSYQARVVAGVHALLGLPVRWLPGTTQPADAEATGFGRPPAWRPGLKALELRYANASQLAAVTLCQTQLGMDDAVWLLAHDDAALQGWAILIGKLESQPDSPQALASAVAARVCGSRRVFAEYQGSRSDSLIAGIDSTPAEQSDVIALAAQLTRAPERFSAAHLQPLLNAGWQPEALFGLIQATALSNWNSRLWYALGEAA
ncbi:CMD domain-containing protein [Candidatus Pantoea multigeneris]|uniref:Oxidoreductase n=1 Tax=Candidatus Pantoea multigeneris TaxID=2608357 RepID=A0ABX0RCV3_9GAMM|nr:oxidoreductase [Pantoea multigeneris]NIF21963.1 oxidoreductase [Pantoea multigeneris]